MMGGQHTRLQSVGVAREFVAGSEAVVLVRGGGVLFQVEFELRIGGCGGGDVEVEQDLDVEVDLVEKRCGLGGGGGTVDTMEGQDPTTVTLLRTNQSGARSLSMMMHFTL